MNKYKRSAKTQDLYGGLAAYGRLYVLCFGGNSMTLVPSVTKHVSLL